MPQPSSEHVRRRFVSQRTRDTSAEVAIRRLIHGMGYRYRVDCVAEESIRSKPDLDFRGPKVAVYVDGCFWHGCPDHFIPPRNNAEWWKEKIEANIRRDERVRSELADLGWTVVAIWEHEDAGLAAGRVVAAVDAARRPRR